MQERHDARPVLLKLLKSSTDLGAAVTVGLTGVCLLISAGC